MEGRCCNRGIVMIKDFRSDTGSTSNVLNVFLSSIHRSICGMQNSVKPCVVNASFKRGESEEERGECVCECVYRVGT